MSDTTGSSQPPTRHRADDDVEAIANGSFDPVMARTPNGDVDLLSGEAAAVLATLSSEENDNNKTNIGNDNDNRGSIPATPFSIDDGIEDEEEFPTSDPSNSTPAIRGQDPDGTGATTNQYTKKVSADYASSVASAGAIGGDPNVNPKMGTKVIKLSHKTTKIMSDYQAYLQEIETEFPSEQGDPALANINDMRSNVRDSFSGGLEEGDGSRLAPVLEDGYISSGAVDNLAREWYRGREKKVLEPNIAVDRTRSHSDDLSAMEQEQFMRGQKYTHPWLHNRRIKRGIFAFMILSVIIGLSIWVANSGNKDLPDWEGEMEEEEEEAKTSAGGPPLNQAPTQSDEDAKQQNEQLYDTVVKRHKPLEFDRTRGWQGQTYAEALAFCESKIKYAVCPYEVLCPAGADSEPLGGYREAPNGGTSWMPIMDAPNEWVEVGSSDPCIWYSHVHGTTPDWGYSGENNEENTRNIMCCMDEAIEDESYKFAQIKYQPLSFDRSQGWVGKTYPEAVEFCGAVEEGPEGPYELCPYDAVCPLGPDSEPLMGALGDDVTTDAWLPVIDTTNGWIQVGQADSCIAYSHEHMDKPDWGMSGEGSEEFTRNIMCCLHQEENTGEEGAISYQVAVSKYHPHFYDRSHGWKGQTFEAALDFCDGIEGYELCPYDAVCPLGIDREPLSAYAEATGPAWIPIIDSANEWVNIGRDGACAKYSDVNSKSPEWGMNGIGNEEITRAIMCCAHPGMVIDPGARPHPNQITEIPKVPLQEVPVPSAEDVQLYVDADAKYSPIWYNRDQGWTGQTYLQALQFCGDSDDGNNELCPFDAICPLGQDTEPLGGYRDEPAGSWVPILDTANAWVQVSSTGDAGGAPCIRYDHENNDSTPPWDLTGEGDEEVTRHVACCLMPSGEAANEITPIPVISPVGKISTPATAPAMADEMVQEIIAIEPEEVITDDEVEQYVRMAEKYKPVWVSRTSGWEGRTYLEAFDFCREKEGYGLCPLEAVCPLGPDSEPLGGYDSQSTNGSWVPIADAPDDWVQVGAEEEERACIRYSSDHLKAPEWGLTGENSEDITQRLVCCMDLSTEFEGMNPDDSAFLEAMAPTAEQTEEEEVSNKKGVMTDEQLSVVYQTVSETYRPKLFDRNQGWKGQTYSEAFVFCADFDFYLPCPYEAICPSGKGTVPLGGNKASNAKGGSWAPILDGPNEWVQLSEDGSCVQWSHLHPGPPPWGETGVGNEELTRNVACCFDSSTTFDPTPKPTDAPTHKPTLLPTKEPTSPPTPPPTTPKPTNLPTETPTRKPTAKPTTDEEEYYKSIVKVYEPMWFSRTNGWQGQTYLEAIQFCATKGSRIPCPYTAYCPVATKNQPLGGFKQGVSWAPIIDGSNAWVQVGEENMCELYSELYNTPPSWGLTGKNDEDLTRHVMCCLEEPLEAEKAEEPPQAVAGEITPLTTAEQTVLDDFKAQWYGRDDGYQGTTYYESQEFCNNVSGMVLCPLEAYCPNGPIHGDVLKPLFLQFEPFEGEQWAPVKVDDGNDDSYVLIGQINNNPATACHTYRHFNKGEIPAWGLDGSKPELKLNILCCKDPNYFSTGIRNPAVDLTIGGPELTDQVDDVEMQIEEELTPEWLRWSGGSHTDAEEFCHSKGGKQICPYAAYCPHGPGQSVSKGHSTDISAEGAQWSPVFGHDNHWVMVGQKHGNSATTCFGHEDLEGGSPDWGLTTEHPEMKKYLMCCHTN